VDVAEFIRKAQFKILSLSVSYNEQVNEKGSSCLWNDVYLLCEAIEIVSSEFATTECIDKIISKLDARYSLSQLTAPSDGGIGEMTVDPSGECNVFTVYA
jgi:hypothetical protein